MSWESATQVLSAKSPTSEQLTALKTFVSEHSNELQLCYAPKNRALRPVLARFVARLFVLLETKTVPGNAVEQQLRAVVEYAAASITRESFFTSLFRAALHDADVALLQLVYAALFTEIVFSSSLTSTWFAERLAAERAGIQYSQLAWSLSVLCSVQFLDLRQDWQGAHPRAQLLDSLDSEISVSNEQVLKLCWSLALFSMAQQHYQIDTTSDDIQIEPLMQSLQQRAGAHWSAVLQDRIQRSLPGLATLMAAHSVVQANHPLLFVSPQLLAQTVADVVSCLASVSKPTDMVCSALAAAVRGFPALQREQWLSEQQLQLVKAKCPYSSAALVHLALTMDRTSRITYLRDMRTYVCATPYSDLVDMQGEELARDPAGEIGAGTDVRSRVPITVLSARTTDGQGTLELEAGTRGTLLGAESGDCLVMWYFTYNGWSLMGRLFENADLAEGQHWQPLTGELLSLATDTVDDSVLAAMSAGLARGDIVDLVANRLQQWVHDKQTNYEYVPLALEFLGQIAYLDPNRVWVLLDQIVWPLNNVIVLHGLRGIVKALWTTYDTKRALHRRVCDILAQLFMALYLLSITNLDATLLAPLELMLPNSTLLQENFLATSNLRETTLAPLLAHLDKQEVLEFCIACLGLVRESNACLQKQLFAHSADLATLFLEKPGLRPYILNLWTMLIENAETPTLLAFLESKQVDALKTEFVAMTKNKLESSATVGDLAQFLAAAKRQEGLLDVLRDTLLPALEDRVPGIWAAALTDDGVPDRVAVRGLLEALKLNPGPLRITTLETLNEMLEQNVSDEAGSLARISAMELLTLQVNIDAKNVEKVVTEIAQLTPKLAAAGGPHAISAKLKQEFHDHFGDLSLHDVAVLDDQLGNDPRWTELRAELKAAQHDVVLQRRTVAAWCAFMRAAGIHAKYVSHPRKQDWARRLLEANTTAAQFTAQSEVVQSANREKDPHSLQRIERAGNQDEARSAEVRTETALSVVQGTPTPAPELLNMVYRQLSELTLSPTNGLNASRRRLVALLQIAATLLYGFDKADEQLRSTALGLLDVVVIKQLQVFGISQDFLTPQLLILRDCLNLLGGAPRALVQSMTESASDLAILCKLGDTPVDQPQMGNLLLEYVHVWLTTGVMTDNFVRNGLVNVLLEAPLARHIQRGNVTVQGQPAMHYLWRNRVLVIMLGLINQLEQRIAQETSLILSAYALQIATCLEQWKSGLISTELADETLLLFGIVTKLRSLDAAAAYEVNFNVDELVKTMEFLLSHRKYLIERLSRDSNAEAVTSSLVDLRDIMRV